MLLIAQPASAQQADGLRGRVSEDEINRSLLNRTPLEDRRTALQRREISEEEDTGFQPDEFDPISEGADVSRGTDREDDAVSIFDLNRDNPFADDDLSTDGGRRRGSSLSSTADDSDDRALTTREQIEAERARRTDDRGDTDEEVITGTVPAARIDVLDDERNDAAEATGERAAAIEGLDVDEEADPFAPLGIRAGRFILFPELEQGLSWSSNADSSSGGEDAILSETTLRLNAQSDWSRHSAQINAFGLFRQTLSGEDVSQIIAGINGDLRLELANGHAANAGIDYQVAPDSAASAVVVAGTTSQPVLHTIVGTLGVAREEGKLRASANGRVEREIYGDADLIGGGVLSQRERNSTLATFTLRTGYEVSPAIVPFVEAEIGRRVFDLDVDSAGFARSADRYAVRAGLEIDLGDKLTGELAAGWVSENPEDSRLVAVEGVSALAALAWSPSRGTTVNLNALTTVETTTTPGSSGSILYDADLGVERQIKANLTGNLNAGLGLRDFSSTGEHDLIFDVEAGLSWWLNRNFGFTGRAAYQIVDSSDASRDAETVSVFVGVRLRR